MKKYIKLFIAIIFPAFIIVSCAKTRHEEKKEKEKVIFKEPFLKANRYLVKKDAERIQSYIKRRNWEGELRPNGLWYMIYEKGQGPKAQTGNIAIINYSIDLLDGTHCYDSDSLGVKKFKIGNGGVEAGLEEGILLMQEGDKARFIMPPHLAWGLIGDQKCIPPRAILVYQVELVKLIQPRQANDNK